MDAYERKRAMFLRAVRYVDERGGNHAVEEAFGDADLVDAAWERPVEDFRMFLRSRARAALRGKAA
jgi:hypothetical protein